MISKKQSGVVSPADYREFLDELKTRIRTAQVKAALSVNRELILLYWGIGRDILDRQKREGWGVKVVDRLSADLQHEFPGMGGFSPRNLKYMRSFAEAYPEKAFVQEVLAQITWYHNITLLDKVKNLEERNWYIQQTVEHGWSRNVLVHQIELDLHKRQGKALTHFKRTLPPYQSDLAQQIVKDPYSFDFLTLSEDALERDLEKGLLAHILRFLFKQKEYVPA
jgi:predicted nuclease of restriction endonuclease-like (RecB) superfamily